MTRTLPFALAATLALSACVGTGTPQPTLGRVATGAGIGAVAGQVVGGDTRSAATGAFLGGIAAAATAPRAPAYAGDPCAQIVDNAAYAACREDARRAGRI
ncbi:hypothetical protein [Palleronia sediminis]|uniref:hypothetical protein n=1 Tax=Palleronia sediminis TaxID=2547833 RepID=UPI001F101562|nr:hypothetical protein [Palleronia sediminis]